MNDQQETCLFTFKVSIGMNWRESKLQAGGWVGGQIHGKGWNNERERRNYVIIF